MKHAKHAITVALIALAALILIWGPRPNAPLPKGRENDVIIQYWEKWDGNEERQMREIVDDFNDSVGKEKHIYVQYLSMSKIDQKTLLATAAGVPPDIAGLWNESLVQYAELGALEPLDDLAAAHGIVEGYYKPVYWKDCHWNGRLYALVSTPAAVALFYNTRIFRENAKQLRAAGLDPDRAPRSIDELDRYAEALDTYSVDANGKRHLDRAGYLPKEPGWYTNQTAYWFGGSLWDEKTKQFTLTDPHVARAYEWIQSYSKRLGKDAISDYSSSVGGFNSPQNAFLSGKVVMEQQGPWMANYIHDLKPSMDGDWAAAPFPTDEPGLKDVTYCPSDMFCIPKGSKHKAEAFEFMAYVNRQDVMEKLCSLHCKNSPLEKVSVSFIKNHPNPYISVFEELSRSPNAHGAMHCAIGPEAGADIAAMTDAIELMKVEPAAALETLEGVLQLKYARYQDEQKARRESEMKG